MTPTPLEVVERYFACMRAGDLAVVELFHDDARLVGLGTVVAGRPAIDEFYAASIAASGPQPKLLAAPLVEGDRVAVEIEIEFSTEMAPMHVLDLFVVEDGRIRSLTYFISDHP